MRGVCSEGRGTKVYSPLGSISGGIHVFARRPMIGTAIVVLAVVLGFVMRFSEPPPPPPGPDAFGTRDRIHEHNACLGELGRESLESVKLGDE